MKDFIWVPVLPCTGNTPALAGGIQKLSYAQVRNSLRRFTLKWAVRPQVGLKRGFVDCSSLNVVTPCVDYIEILCAAIKGHRIFNRSVQTVITADYKTRFQQQNRAGLVCPKNT
jgi:hypothetical protein